MKKLLDMEMNETLKAEMKFGVRYDILKVYNGWIYQPIVRSVDGKDTFLQPLFVPCNFKEAVF